MLASKRSKDKLQAIRVLSCGAAPWRRHQPSAGVGAGCRCMSLRPSSYRDVFGPRGAVNEVFLNPSVTLNILWKKNLSKNGLQWTPVRFLSFLYPLLAPGLLQLLLLITLLPAMCPKTWEKTWEKNKLSLSRNAVAASEMSQVSTHHLALGPHQERWIS